jgi:hypothetical protein
MQFLAGILLVCKYGYVQNDLYTGIFARLTLSHLGKACSSCSGPTQGVREVQCDAFNFDRISTIVIVLYVHYIVCVARNDRPASLGGSASHEYE